MTGYEDQDSMQKALAGVETLFLVPVREHPERVRLHTTAVDAAVAAGVRRIVYSSFLGAGADSTFTLARDHYATEEHIRSKGVAFTFLRGSAYLEVLRWIIGSDGVIRGPAGDGRLAPVARDDMADTVANVLSSDGAHDGETYDVTGPESVSLQQVAHEFALVTGRRIAYVNETPEEALASRRASGAADWQIAAWVSTYLQIAAGELESSAIPSLASPATQRYRSGSSWPPIPKTMSICLTLGSRLPESPWSRGRRTGLGGPSSPVDARPRGLSAATGWGSSIPLSVRRS